MASYTPEGWTADALSRMLAAAEGQGAEAAPQHIRNAVTVLIEAARRWQHLAVDHLYPLLPTRLDLAIAAGGAALTALAAIDDIDMIVLEGIEPLLPDGRHVDLDIGAAAITYRLADHRLTGTSDPAHCATLHAALGWRLGNAGLHRQALAPTEEATGIYRQLAQPNLAAYLLGLARGLWGFAWVRAAVGLELPEALTAVKEAIAIYQRLAEEIPEAFGGDLLSARYTLADILDGLGRHDEAAELRRQIGGDAAPDDG